MKISKTDVVQLLAGGEFMTIERIVGEVDKNTNEGKIEAIMKISHQLEDGDIICQWFIGKKIEKRVFKPHMLRIVSEDELKEARKKK